MEFISNMNDDDGRKSIFVLSLFSEFYLKVYIGLYTTARCGQVIPSIVIG